MPWSPDTTYCGSCGDRDQLLILCRPVEEAFDNGYLSITWDGRRGESRSQADYLMHWLGDPDLLVQDMPHYPWKASAEKLPNEVQMALRG